ncbi:MAG TPA: hydantoinase/oxoprolinase family protein [Gammaproteobacteria bacterium]|nr:hydantoinase/oxoprolinase family protein [Gammaproteobacteria bacterium]
MLLGVDTGGTFTDFVWFDGERLKIHKVLSTPGAPEQAILQGIRELGLDGRNYHLVHGSTVATNAVLEGKGVRTLYITNYGLADVLTIGRQARRELYKLQPRAVPPPVPPDLCLETGGRLGADGSVVEPLGEQELDALAARVQALAPQAVAINLLFSYLDERFERQIEARLPDTLFISRSSDILPEQGEYERGIATWLNAWVGPRVEGYVRRLQQAVQPAPVHVMQSSARTIAAQQAARRAVNLLLSGPAGGLMGALHIGATLGRRQLLTFDMGGTSTDVALLDGAVSLTSEGRIGRYPVAVPMVDMHTIGAGGGSIARVDEGGMLAVGPESAGADPGPACYGQGGRLATVTDANLVLGRLRPSAFLGGKLQLDTRAAEQALERLAERMGLPRQQAAGGVIDLANEHMAQALRVISVQRGVDPSGYTLTAFGGAGGLHVCALAEALDMRHALVPVHAGVLSALGMLAAPRGRQLSHTLNGLLDAQRDDRLRARFRKLEEQGQAELRAEGVARADIRAEFSLDLRYRGQSFTLNVPFRDVARAGQDFHAAHQRRFGHRLDAAVELVNLRVGLSASGSELSLVDEGGTPSGRPFEQALLAGIEAPVPVWRRHDLDYDRPYRGPLLVIDDVASTWIAPGWGVRRHASGCLLLERE